MLSVNQLLDGGVDVFGFGDSGVCVGRVRSGVRAFGSFWVFFPKDKLAGGARGDGCRDGGIGGVEAGGLSNRLYEIVPGFVANCIVISFVNIIVRQKDAKVLNGYEEVIGTINKVK